MFDEFFGGVEGVVGVFVLDFFGEDMNEVDFVIYCMLVEWVWFEEVVDIVCV